VRRLLQPLQEPPPLRGIVRIAGGEREGDGCPGIRGNPMKPGVPFAPGPADALGTVFSRAPVPSGCTLCGCCRGPGPRPGSGSPAPAAGARTRGPERRSSTTGSCACRRCARCRSAPAGHATCSRAMRPYCSGVSSTCLLLRNVSTENTGSKYTTVMGNCVNRS